jgi:hypothetical protein
MTEWPSQMSWANDVASQSMSLPESVVLHAIVSWHLVHIGTATHKGEAIFHWKQIKYYRNHWQNAICQPGDKWLDGKEMIEELRKTGKCNELIEAIDRHELSEVE